MRKIIVIALGALLGSLAAASELNVPNTFVAGTRAVAADVNENFTSVETAVNDNLGRITTNTNNLADLSDRSWQAAGSDIYFDTGNVGIGTAPQGATLRLVNQGNTGSERVLAAFSPNENEGAFSGSIFFGDSDGPRETGHLAFVDSAIDGQEIISFAIHSAGILMVIQGDGDVGLGGITNPNFPLEMASGAYVSLGGVWVDASSRDFKENIRDLDYREAQDTLAALNPMKFTFKADQDEEYLGFIAEDVPDLVATQDRKGLSSMDIVAVLTKVVQQQQQEIATLKYRLDTMSD